MDSERQSNPATLMTNFMDSMTTYDNEQVACLAAQCLKKYFIDGSKGAVIDSADDLE